MQKGSRQAPDNFEAETLPKPYGPLVGADDKVELHGTEASSFGVVERMLTHRARHASAGGANIGHVAAIGYVRASTFLIGMHVIGADYLSVFLRDEYFVVLREPMGDGLFPCYIVGQGVSFRAPDGGLHYFPDRIGIAAAGSTDGYHGTNIADDESRIYSIGLSDIDNRGLSGRADRARRGRGGDACAHLAARRRYPLRDRCEPGVGDRYLFRRRGRVCAGRILQHPHRNVSGDCYHARCFAWRISFLADPDVDSGHHLWSGAAPLGMAVQSRAFGELGEREA